MVEKEDFLNLPNENQRCSNIMYIFLNQSNDARGNFILLQLRMNLLCCNITKSIDSIIWELNVKFMVIFIPL